MDKLTRWLPEKEYITMGDPRSDFMQKSQEYGQSGGFTHTDAGQSQEEREFQKRLDDCKEPRERWMLMNEYMGTHDGQLPRSYTDQGHQAGQVAGNAGHSDQDSGKDPRADYLEKLRQAGMTVDRNDSMTDQQAPTVKRVFRTDAGAENFGGCQLVLEEEVKHSRLDSGHRVVRFG